MTSLFTSWIGSSKLNSDVEQGPSDPARTRAMSSGSNPMSPVDRAASMTPKAPFQFGTQPEWNFMASRDHHREASEATLNGRASEPTASQHPPTASHPYNGSLVKPTASRPTSVANGSDLGHERLTTFSSTLGGVDSEAAWSVPPSEGARNSAARRRKKIAPPELLVIVKPPPSKQTNPLNLQIQLVMPQQLQSRRDGSQRRSSMDSSVSPGGDLPTTPSTELRRRDSITSTRSAGSEVSTTNSVASGSSGRRVTPLYNLNFHQILSTTVSDAGTDQKVAKYVKRGIDLDGLGILEPAELIHGVNDLASLQKVSAMDKGSSTVQAGNVTNISPRSETDSSGGAVDDASAFSAPGREATSSTVASSVVAEPPTSFQAMTPEARGVEANLGGKLLGKFKRFSLGVRPGTGSGGGGGFGRDAASTQDRTAAGSSAAAPSLFGKLSAANDATRGHHSAEIPQMQPGAGIADGKRTEGYFWTVRKWNRKAHDGAPANFAGRASALASPSQDAPGSNPVLTNVWSRFNLVNRMGGNEPHPPLSQIPVRFEWTRNSKKTSKRQRTEEARARLRASVSLNASVTSFDRHPAVGVEASRSNTSLARSPRLATTSASAQSLGVDHAASPRLSTGDAVRSTSRPSSFISGTGHRSPRQSVDTSAAGSSAPHGDNDDDDSGNESDPEDSETPWNCHLVLGPTTRIPLGTLSPAPHHPKLVGQLAVPFPLPDLSGTGLGPDGAGLTREELKDVIIVTCLHLIVRESFGGLARRRSTASTDAGGASVMAGSTMANVNGWRLANLPKKQS